MQKAVNADTIRHLGREVHGLEQLMAAPWFAATSALRVPRLTDYMSIRHAEAVLPQAPPLRPREYDEKFHILEAPGLFLPDLAHYRARCALRGASIAVAFIDIDDFKAFNVQHTETAVDLHVLPPFMESIEAHVFAHGHAYRFGGDEYLITVAWQGLAPISAPPASVTCGQNSYNTAGTPCVNDLCRRVVTTVVRIPTLT